MCLLTETTMSLDEQFKKAADEVNNLKAKPSNDDLLEIYALFKQGSIGDVNTGILLQCILSMNPYMGIYS